MNEIPFKGYNSKKSLLHQIFRRYSLIVQNNLTDEEVEWRSRILGESFSEDAKKALKKLLSKTLALRDFDYLRQTLVFNYVYKNSDYFKNIKYLKNLIILFCLKTLYILKKKNIFKIYKYILS